MATLLLFVDGVGVGADDPGANPFAAIDARRLPGFDAVDFADREGLDVPLRRKPVPIPPAWRGGRMDHDDRAQVGPPGAS